MGVLCKECHDCWTRAIFGQAPILESDEEVCSKVFSLNQAIVVLTVFEIDWTRGNEKTLGMQRLEDGNGTKCGKRRTDVSPDQPKDTSPALKLVILGKGEEWRLLLLCFPHLFPPLPKHSSGRTSNWVVTSSPTPSSSSSASSNGFKACWVLSATPSSSLILTNWDAPEKPRPHITMTLPDVQRVKGSRQSHKSQRPVAAALPCSAMHISKDPGYDVRDQHLASNSEYERCQVACIAANFPAWVCGRSRVQLNPPRNGTKMNRPQDRARCCQTFQSHLGLGRSFTTFVTSPPDLLICLSAFFCQRCFAETGPVDDLRIHFKVLRKLTNVFQAMALDYARILVAIVPFARASFARPRNELTLAARLVARKMDTTQKYGSVSHAKSAIEQPPPTHSKPCCPASHPLALPSQRRLCIQYWKQWLACREQPSSRPCLLPEAKLPAR
ncbi:uncharacterized protein CLUP02_10819 [Colletotrichum lupini]|uniref:Uncharacterized protein n=1 Tax=Colletotrichum lupini TaxID=145971 RepID=A0A9Q8SZ74_9PEZI|nr:uncharacterized protein CLUP02_10819 [Colletotrichum lupini]UQC85322.1 hypothetical protein CLUP02_10819 [Colletotrichum lupini]